MSDETGKALRRLKARLRKKFVVNLLGCHPQIWTANLLAVYHLNPDCENLDVQKPNPAMASFKG